MSVRRRVLGLSIGLLIAGVGTVTAAPPQVEAEAGTGVQVDSNLHRVSVSPKSAIGPAHFGRLHLTTETPLFLIQGRWGLRSALLVPEGAQYLLPADLHGAARIEVGPRDVFSLGMDFVGGGRMVRWPVMGQPEGDPVELVALPEVPIPAGTGPENSGFLQLRARLGAELRGQPTDGLILRGFGGVWLRRSGSGTAVDRYGGGGGFEVLATPPGAPVTIVGRAIMAEHLHRIVPPSSIRGFGAPQEPFVSSEGLRVGGVGGVHLRPSEVLRLDVEVGWLAARVRGGVFSIGPADVFLGAGDEPQVWVVGPEGLVGRVEATLRPNELASIAVGIGRKVTTASLWRGYLPVGRTSGWFDLDVEVRDRVWVAADFSVSRLDTLPADAWALAWTGSGGVDVRIVDGLHVRARGGVEAINPSSDDLGEFVAMHLWAGIVFRPVGQGSLDGGW